MLLVAVLHLPAVQGVLGSWVAAAVADKLGTKVEVGRVDFGFLNRLIIDDVLICDQRNKDMLRVARLSVRVDVAELMQGRVSVSSAQLFSPRLSLYKASATAKPNYQFAIDSLASKDTTKKNALNIQINSFIMRHGSVNYDRHDIAPVNGRFSTAHIGITDMSANIQLKALRNDSVNVNVRSLSFKERSGLRLDRLSLKLEGGRSGARLSEFCLKLPHSCIEIPNLSATYTTKADGKPDIAAISYKGEIGKSLLTLADASSIVPVLGRFATPLQLSAKLEGTADELQVQSLDVDGLTSGLAIDAGGWLRWSDGKPLLWRADVRKAELSEQSIADIYNALNTGGQLPVAIGRLGNVGFSGVVESTEAQSVSASLTVGTSVGDVDADVSLARNGNFTSEFSTDGVALGQFMDNRDFGKVVAKVDVSGYVAKKQPLSMSVNGNIPQFEYKGYPYKSISLQGTYSSSGFNGEIAVNDSNACFNIDGSLNKEGRGGYVQLLADIKRITPATLGLTNRWGDATFTAMVDVDVHGSSIEEANGTLNVSNLRMVSSTADYVLDNLSIASGLVDDGKRYLKMNSDFGHVELIGHYNIETLPVSLTNFVGSKLPTLPGLPTRVDGVSNNCLLSATFTDTEWLDKLFGVPLTIKQPVTINGKIDDDSEDIYMNFIAPEFSYDGQGYHNTSFAITSPGDYMHCDIRTVKSLDNGDRLSLNFSGRANDNRLSAILAWSNDKRIAGQLNADAEMSAVGEEKEIRVDVRQSYIDIDGTKWVVSPSSIVYTDKRLFVDHFSVSHGSQHIAIDGTASQSRADSLTVDLNGVDVGYVLNLVNFHAVEFGGQASGRAYVKAPFGETTAEGKFKIRKFTFRQGNLGTLDADVRWNEAERQIDIEGTAADGPSHRLLVNGYVSPSRRYIDLDMKAEGTRLEFMRSFTHSFSKDIDGTARGEVRLAGPLSSMNLTGQLVVEGAATIDPLGCRYTLQGDTVRFVPNEILVENALLYDKDGHKGWMTGGFHHKNLKNLSYDFDISADNLLVYDFKDFGDDTFYGTVYGTGHVDIHGQSGKLDLNVDIRPNRNTTFVYNVSNPDAISSQEFIHWNDVTQGRQFADTQTVERKPMVIERLPGTDVRLNFTLDVTSNATMKLLMDSRTNDYITLNGHGAIRASYYNRSTFNMYGTYTVERGTYGITIQDIIKKNFTFNDGGTIVFGGDPFDAQLDLQAVYTVNGVSLSDLNIGNSFSSNTIRVNCLMNIGGYARQPVVTFDMDMPTVSTDEKQMVRSVLNGEDEMNQQVLYLLGIGRFYPQGANNATAQDGRQQSQTSLAMQSLLSGTISSQINSLLGTVINSNNWNFGANISTGDEGWNNAEYEGILSGRMLNNRLLVNGQFGYRDNANTATTSFIGDFDIRYLLLPNGNLALKVYNQTNDRYFTTSSLNTQGVGLIIKKDFTNIFDLFGRKKKR